MMDVLQLGEGRVEESKTMNKNMACLKDDAHTHTHTPICSIWVTFFNDFQFISKQISLPLGAPVTLDMSGIEAYMAKFPGTWQIFRVSMLICRYSRKSKQEGASPNGPRVTWTACYKSGSQCDECYRVLATHQVAAQPLELQLAVRLQTAWLKEYDLSQSES